MSEELQDCRKLAVKFLPLLLSMNFSFLKCSPVDILLGSSESTVTTAIVAIQSCRSCGRTARTSASLRLLRLVDPGRGSESPLKASGEANPCLPVGTVLEGLVTPPTVRETTRAGGRRNRWRKDWAQGSATRRTALGATSMTRPSRRVQDRRRTRIRRPACATTCWTILTIGPTASTMWTRRRTACARVGAASLMMTALQPISNGLRRD